MEQRLIDANALLKYIDENESELRDDPFDGAFDGLKEVIRQFPTIDAVQVVRCGECEHKREQKNGQKYCGLHGSHYAMTLTDDWFCADGERKNEPYEVKEIYFRDGTIIHGENRRANDEH